MTAAQRRWRTRWSNRARAGAWLALLLILAGVMVAAAFSGGRDPF